MEKIKTFESLDEDVNRAERELLDVCCKILEPEKEQRINESIELSNKSEEQLEKFKNQLENVVQTLTGKKVGLFVTKEYDHRYDSSDGRIIPLTDQQIEKVREFIKLNPSGTSSSGQRMSDALPNVFEQEEYDTKDLDKYNLEIISDNDLINLHHSGDHMNSWNQDVCYLGTKELYDHNVTDHTHWPRRSKALNAYFNQSAEHIEQQRRFYALVYDEAEQVKGKYYDDFADTLFGIDDEYTVFGEKCSKDVFKHFEEYARVHLTDLLKSKVNTEKEVRFGSY